MAFPTSGAPSATNISSAAEPQTVNIGSPTQGQMLLALARVPAGGGFTLPSGWNELKDLTQAGSSSDRILVAWKYLTAGSAEIGSATMSVDVDVGATARLGAWLVWKISGAANQAPQISADATGTNANPDPGSVTPTGGTAKDYLVFALAAAEGEQTTPYGTLPTNYSLYSGGANTGTGGAVATNATLTGAARELNSGAAIDPGTFTMSAADDWIAWTVIVHPAASQSVSITKATEVDTAQALVATKPIRKTLGVVSTVDTARPRQPLKLTPVSSPSSAQALKAVKSKTLGIVSVVEAAKALSYELASGGLQTPAFDADLGSSTNSPSHDTEAAAASGSRVFAAVWAYDASDLTSATDDGPGLTWVRDEFHEFGDDPNHQIAVFSADAPAGMASGTTFTPALAAGTPDFGFGITMWSATGIRGGASGYIEDTSEAHNFDEDWATPTLDTVIEKAFVVGVSMAADTTTHVADTNYTETGPEFVCEGVSKMVAVYRVVTSAGSWTPGGVWSGTALFQQDIGVAYKAASGGGGTEMTLTAVTVAHAAQALTFIKPIRKTLGTVSVADTAQALSIRIRKTLGIVSTVDSARVLAAAKSKLLGTVTETDTARALTFTKTIFKTLGVVSVVNTARALTAAKSKLLGVVTVADTTRALTFIKPIRQTLGTATEVDTARSFTTSGNKTLGIVTTVDTARALTFIKPIFKTLGTVSTVDSARALSIRIRKTLGIVTTVDTARALSFVKPIRQTLGTVSTVDSARSLAFTKVIFKALTVVSSPNTAQALDKDKRVTVGTVSSPSSARSLTFIKPIRMVLGVVSSLNQARPLTFSGPIQKTLDPAVQPNTAQPLTFTKTIFKLLGVVSQPSSARALSFVKPLRKTVSPAPTTDTARPVSFVKAIYKSIVPVTTGSSARELFAGIGIRVTITPVTTANVAKALFFFVDTDLWPQSDDTRWSQLLGSRWPQSTEENW